MHHGVEGVDECSLDHRRATVRLANPLDELVVVAVLPELVMPRAGPWSLALQDLVTREHVEPDQALYSWVVLKDEAVVRRGSHKPALAAKLDTGLPALVFLRLALLLGLTPGKVLHHGHALLRESDACPWVRLSHAAHGQIGRKPVDRSIRIRLGVLLAVKVYAHQVEGVDFLVAARVSAMMGVQPLVLICHRASGGGPRQVGVPTRTARTIDFAQEGVDYA